MVFPIVGGTQSTGYEISNSLRFNDGDSPILTRTPSSAGDTQKFTYSTWFKRSVISSESYPFLNAGSNASNYFRLNFESNDTIAAFSISGGSTDFEYATTQVFRDPSAWYHLVFAVDTTNGTEGNRLRLYINGSEVTSFSAETHPSQNLSTDINGTTAHYIGRRTPANDGFYDGYLTETHLVDGSQLAPTSFGEFDDNGVWVPIKYTGTYGTNGYFLQFKQTGTSQNSSGIGADTSGQDNHYAVTNLAATDVTTDTCTNNFCTLNPLTQSEPGNSPTFAEGNLKITMANFDTESVMATMGVTKGKWYWEVKGGWTTGNWGFGIEKASSSNIGFNVGYTSTSYSFSQGGWKQHNSSASQIDSGLGNTDIIGYALDLDNGYFNFSQNGVWYNGSASESTTFDTSNHDFTSLDFGSEFVMPTISGFANTSITTEINFGNPSFAISSSNADGNGYGNFEYSVPSGYYALCTKNLAEFG